MLPNEEGRTYHIFFYHSANCYEAERQRNEGGEVARWQRKAARRWDGAQMDPFDFLLHLPLISAPVFVQQKSI